MESEVTYIYILNMILSFYLVAKSKMLSDNLDNDTLTIGTDTFRHLSRKFLLNKS